nr:hypothetical protein [uncultured Acetobacterium sp.]
MKKTAVKILSALLMLSMVFSSNVFAAEKTNSAWDSFVGLFGGNVTTAADTQVDGVTYRTHVQNEGWAQGWVNDGETSGTVGKGLRLEGLEVKIDNTKLPAGLGITYQTQIENEGWAQGWVSDGAMSGSEGKGLRLEGVQIKLTGTNASDYSVRYKTQIQNIGWETDWSYDGATSGTVGQALRLEAIQIEIVQKEADLTAYNAALAAVTQADYTAASWTAYQAVVAANPAVATDLQSKVDAATAAIVAAQTDVLVKVPSVTGASAIHANTLEVTFNTAISAADQAKITFDVKRGTTVTTMLAPVWALDGKSVALPRSANLIAGTYTVTASGIEFAAGKNVGTAVVVAQKATSMQLTTARVMDAAAQSIGYVVTDQYSDTMTVAPGLITVTAFNTTASGRTVNVAGGIANLDFTNTELNDVVKITAYLTSDPTIKAVKDVTVSNITLGTVTLGEPVLPEGSTRFVTGLAGVVIPVSAFDNFGEATELTAAAWATGVPTADGLFPVFTGASFTSVAVNADGNLVVTLGAAGTATLTVTNPATGDIIVKTITVVGAPDTATVTMTLPTDPIRIGTAAVIPFTVKDQFGEELTVPGPGWNTADVVLTSSNPAVATVAWNIPTNEITVTPVSVGTTTIFANVVTPVSTGTATLAITVNTAKVPTLISVSGTPKTTLAQGETVAAAAETGALKFDIVDQDGAPINLAAAAAVGVKANLTVTDTNHVLAAPVAQVLDSLDMSATVGTTNGITVTAAAVNGNATVTVQLFNDLNSNNVMDAGEALDSIADVAYTVSSSALTSGEFSAIEAPGVLNAAGTAAYIAPNAAARTITYALLDQAGNPFTTTAATNVVWTIKNNGTTAITVNDGAAKTLAAGATATYTTASSVGAAATATIDIISEDAKKVDVNAKATGIATGSDLAVYFYNTLVSGVSTYAGTVVAVDTDAQWMVVQTAVGNVVLKYADAVTFDEGIAYTIDGSTATEAQFDTNLTVGDHVNIAVTGALALSVDLTN